MFQFLIMTLVTWRISYMVVEEDGPFDCFVHLRAYVNNTRLPVLDCFKCTSVWVGVIFGVFYAGIAGIGYGLALSALAIFMEAAHQKLTRKR